MIIRATHNAGPSPSSNTIEVPRQTSWHVPTGHYAAQVRSVRRKFRQTADSSIPIVAFLLTIKVPGAMVDYLAKIEFKEDMNDGSDLWNVLCRLVGRKRIQDCSGSTFDLDSLVGLECDVEIEHVHGRASDYAFPLVIVTNVQSAGTLVKQADTKVTQS